MNKFARFVPYGTIVPSPFFSPRHLPPNLFFEQLFISGRLFHTAENMETTTAAVKSAKPQTTGLVLHQAAGYDLLVWLVMHGREKAFRERLVQLARVQPRERVLDVGCGTGSLAVAVRRQIPSATVFGLDASPEMIARARKKALRSGVEIDFRQSIAEAIPFPDAQFDVAFATVMLHHLGPAARRACATDIRRVLKPGGRWLLVDFEGPARHAGGILRFFHRHGHIKPGDLAALARDAGFEIVESGAVGQRNLHFVLATVPGHAQPEES